MSGKSAPYCRADTSNNVGLFLLCEVALGNSRELLKSDQDADNLPKDYHSTKALGVNKPSPEVNITIDKDVTVPTGIANHDPDNKLYLSHNEYIVYNVNQVKMRYLLKVGFKY